MDNAAIAAKLRDFASLLEQQGADGFRQMAYRRAADTIDRLGEPLSAILVREGRDGLIALPSIGKGIAGAIAEMTETGRWTQLERLRGELAPEKLFRTLPGIGPKLAEMLAGETDAETLEELETALRLGEVRVPGIGGRRREMLLAALNERLQRLGGGRTKQMAASPPPVAMILDVDRLYRERAKAGKLRRIAPKRMNPEGKAWLPVMHARHDDWHFTALFSNTALAHQLGRTGDWVVIYFHEDDRPEGRCTVVTETRGELEGRRVVRGREAECLAHYAANGKS